MFINICKQLLSRISSNFNQMPYEAAVWSDRTDLHPNARLTAMLESCLKPHYRHRLLITLVYSCCLKLTPQRNALCSPPFRRRNEGFLSTQSSSQLDKITQQVCNIRKSLSLFKSSFILQIFVPFTHSIISLNKSCHCPPPRLHSREPLGWGSWFRPDRSQNNQLQLKWQHCT